LAFNKKQSIPNFRRIKSGEEFRLALAANLCSSKWFVIYARGNKVGVSRLGIIASKKVAPYAVNRNYAKRLIRESFRRNFPVRCALDIVVRLRCPLSQDTSHEGWMALTQLLSDIRKRCVSF
jgi:ribonuclease P protein component